MNLLNKIKSYIFPFIESTIRNVSGPVGIKIRRLYYKHKLRKCGKNIRIDEGVIIQGEDNIYIGNNVWIDKYSVLIAGSLNIDNSKCKNKINKYYNYKDGELHVGSNVHLGVGTIIQAHGGVQIGDYFTTSSGCKIYSLSNDVMKCKKGTYNHEAIYYIKSPITIGNNVWLGLNTIVLGGCIQDDSFIVPGSIVIYDIPKNSIASGQPAISIKERIKNNKNLEE